MTNGRELKSDDPNTFMQGIALNTIINKPQCPKDIKESEKGKIPDKKRSRHERYGLQRRCCKFSVNPPSYETDFFLVGRSTRGRSFE